MGGLDVIDKQVEATLTQNRDEVTVRFHVADLELPPDRSRIAVAHIAEASAVRAALSGPWHGLRKSVLPDDAVPRAGMPDEDDQDRNR